MLKQQTQESTATINALDNSMDVWKLLEIIVVKALILLPLVCGELLQSNETDYLDYYKQLILTTHCCLPPEHAGSGCNFEINTNFDEDVTNKIFDELNLGSDDEEENDRKSSSEELRDLVSPRIRPFVERKENMLRFNPYIWKKVMKAGIIGSSFNFYTGIGEDLEGLEVAVCTMQRGEQTQFVIWYHLLFRELETQITNFLGKT
uniref:Uncharacterized protein n=1 Tax=Glossina brevipalpis TaxID=37001 RepID=A0A1A9WR50_9MUSC